MTEQKLIDELQALTRQKTEAQAQLHRIDGAEQMCRHLLAKLHEQPAAPAMAEEEPGEVKVVVPVP